MTKRTIRLAAAFLAVTALLAAGSGSAARRVSGVTIKVTDKGTSYIINRRASDTMYFSPATTTVKSGSMLTFEYGGKPAEEPHTITIVSQKDLPKTPAQIDTCMICQKLAAGHLKNPKAPPGPTNDIAHWTLNAGNPGLDTVGDSIAIEGAKHKSISIKVTAPPGTTLYFLCAVHPWMQARLVVT
jgi:plastocyanin